MNEDSPRVEPLPRFDHYSGAVPELPWHQSSRVKLFGVTFGSIFVLGLIWTLLQPAVYRSSGTVLMSAPVAIDAVVSEANLQNVTIQRTILLGEEITRGLLDALATVHEANLDSGYLREVLRVDQVPDTNLIEMMAQGADEELLPVLVSAWIDVYVDARAENIEQRKAHTVQLIQDQLDSLAIKIEEARNALELYRQQNNIISAKREENQVLARLDGLNKALNNAIEEEVKTKVYVDTLRESIENGQIIIPKGELRSLQNLENELQQLRAEMLELSKRYTKEYINKHPSLQAIPERIGELEADLAARLSDGQQVELAAAQQAYSAARRSVLELQKKLDEHKQKITQFNAVYAPYQALIDDLARLEELNRETLARQVQVEVRRVEKYPQVSVIERPGTAERIGPDYLVMLGITLAVALGCGIFSVWLYAFLLHSKSRPSYVTLSGVHLHPQEANRELVYTSEPDSMLAHEESRLLRQEESGDSGGGAGNP